MVQTEVIRLDDLELRIGNQNQTVSIMFAVDLDGITTTLIQGSKRKSLRLGTRLCKQILFSVGRACRDVLISRLFT